MTQTIGEQLKQARLARGMTIEQVSKATHIREHFLEALEKDRRDALPSAVQGRGFLRLYAGHLGLPVEPLLAAWEGKPDAAPVEAPKAEPDPTETVARIEPLEEHYSMRVEPEEDSGPPGSTLIFQVIGEKLRRQRETLGLSMEEVERYTHLRKHYIQAIEDGNLDGLPSPVQGRGMLSNYASFLNLDEEAILLEFAEGLQARRVERLPPPEPQPLLNPRKRQARQAPLWRRFITPDLIFGVGIAVVILSFILWASARISSLRNAEVEPTQPPISAILLTPAFSEGTAQVTGTPESESPPVTTAISGATGGEFEQPVEQTATASNVEPLGTATLPPMNRDPLQVYIVARQRAWLRVIADGKIKFLGRVVPGNAYAFSGTKQVEISTGNAAGLQVFFNQTDLGTLGTTGEMVGMVFTSEGWMTPTAAFTATPLPTKPATATPQPTPTSRASPTITPFVP